MMKRGFKSDAERLALAFRSQLQLANDAALPARTLAQHLNISIIDPRTLPGIPPEVLAIVCRNHQSSFSAIMLPVDDRRIIIHNPAHSAARQESDLMHEIAHVVCKHKYEPKPQHLGFALLARTYEPDHEEEANFLGGCLQAPRETLIRHLARGKTETEIAAHLGASEDLVRYRINLTGVSRQLSRWKTQRYGR